MLGDPSLYMGRGSINRSAKIDPNILWLVQGLPKRGTLILGSSGSKYYIFEVSGSKIPFRVWFLNLKPQISEPKDPPIYDGSYSTPEKRNPCSCHLLRDSFLSYNRTIRYH